MTSSVASAGLIVVCLASPYPLSMPTVTTQAVGQAGSLAEIREDDGLGIFAYSSPLYRRLPHSTPVDRRSGLLVRGLIRQSTTYWGRQGKPNVTINVNNYTPPLYITQATDPLVRFVPWNCQHKEGTQWATDLTAHIGTLRLADWMKADTSSDGYLSVYDASSDTAFDFWAARREGDILRACWGGAIKNASQSVGVHLPPYGASASGISFQSYVIRHKELAEGHINHVIGLGIPEVQRGVVSAPAVRTDGLAPGPALAMGQFLRLSADLNIDRLGLSPAARTIAKAAQQYGIAITDTSGALSFYAENELSAGTSYDKILRGRWPSQEMSGDPARGENPFPLHLLEVLPLGYQPPTNAPSSVRHRLLNDFWAIGTPGAHPLELLMWFGLL